MHQTCRLRVSNRPSIHNTSETSCEGLLSTAPRWGRAVAILTPEPTERTMVNQGDAAIARLRLFLADIEGKEKQLQAVRRQFRDQMERVIGFALYHEASVDQTISMMGDVNEREREVERMLGHLVRLRDRVQAELESLVLTR